MDNIKTLKIKKLIKQLNFIEEEYEYTNDILSEADYFFIKSVDDFLNQYPELKEIYNEKLEENVNTEVNIKNEESKNKEHNSSDFEENKSNFEKSKKIKKLYRDIVKLTHPDKTKDIILNNIYIEATNFYDKNDKIGMYKICDSLNINYEIEDFDEESIKSKISDYKKRISFLESTFTWTWFEEKDEKIKKEILFNFIKNKIK